MPAHDEKLEQLNVLLAKYDKKFETYYELLIKRNNEFNLTAITDRKNVWLKHFTDSLTAVPFIDEGAEVVDVGSGAGFPGVVLKLVREDIKLTLVESVRKKADFLKELVETLELDGVTVLNCRCEDLPKTKLFDYGVARAVAKTVTLAEYILPFIKIGGYFIAYKAKDAEQEIVEAQKAIETLGGKLEKIESLSLDGMERNLLFIKKLCPTPPKYPRGGNKPKSHPII